MKWILIILIFGSCMDVDFQVDPRLKPYFNQFAVDAKEYGVTIDRDNLIMTLKDLRPGKHGLYSPAIFQKYVYIDSTTFFTRPEIVNLIVYHELGHAFLGRDHNETFSYMNPRETWSSKTWIQIDSLNQELFK